MIGNEGDKKKGDGAGVDEAHDKIRKISQKHRESQHRPKIESEEEALALVRQAVYKKKANMSRPLKPNSGQLKKLEKRLPQNQPQLRGKPLLTLSVNEPQDSPELDQQNLRTYASRFAAPEYQKTAQRLDNFIYHLTFDRFLKALKDSVIGFEFAMRTQFPDDSYCIGIEPEHSLQWVGGLAMRYLDPEYLPSTVLQLGCPYGGGRKFTPQEALPQNTQRVHVALFDDCAYSGSQMSEKIIYEYNKLSKSMNGELHLHLVIPFMTTYSARKIQESVERANTNFKVHLYNSCILPSYRQLPIDPQELNRLADMIDSAGRSFADVSKKTGQTLMYSDWKNPDAWSVPYNITEGRVPTLLKENTRADAPYVPNSPFIPEIKKPYGKK